MTINSSMRYLVTEEIEEEDIVYGQTDRRTAGRRTKGYHISSTGLRPVELKGLIYIGNIKQIPGGLVGIATDSGSNG